MLVATFHLELDAIALTHAFEAAPSMQVEAERIAAHSTEWTMPCLWIAHDEFDVIDRALEADPSVHNIVSGDVFGAEKFYHVEWEEAVADQLDLYLDKGGSILTAEATEEGWEVTLRFGERDQFDTFRQIVQARGFAFELLDLTEPGVPRTKARGVTPRQREALLAAVEMGYFEVPRNASADAVADALETSQQALSELLRRGTKNLVTATLESADQRTGAEEERLQP